MLVLTRKQNESIVLPDLNLTIRVSGISGGRVRLAIDGPRDVHVLRKEVAERLPPRGQLTRSADCGVLV